jgi:hypothetical protein
MFHECTLGCFAGAVGGGVTADVSIWCASLYSPFCLGGTATAKFRVARLVRAIVGCISLKEMGE